MSTTKWCFTVNENARLFYVGLEALALLPGIRYICGQLEKAPETGQIHFQGYLQLRRSQRLSWCKKNISKTAHFEIQKASKNTSARDYCKKSDTQQEPFIEFGTFAKGQGARTDLAAFRDSVKGGSRIQQLIEDSPEVFARYRHFYSTLREIYHPPQFGLERKVSIYYGEPGTGKTRLAVSHADMWKAPIDNGTMWFDGYDGQTVVVLDDFSGKMSRMQLNYTLRLLDRYPERVPVKGGFTWWNPCHIIITTNYHPRAWYDWTNREVSYRALERRISEVIEFTMEDQSFVDVKLFFRDRELWPIMYHNANELQQ